MDLKAFTAPQEVIPYKNPIKLNWIIAIDIGFSSVKGMSPNKRFCFPSYVKKIEENLSAIDENDIYYRDEDGMYLIGTKAQDLIKNDDTNDTNSSFDRNRYFTKDFIILARTAVAIGLMNNEIRKTIPQVKPYVETGLPAAYLKEDAPKIKAAFAKPGIYEIKIGSGPWKKFENTLKQSDIGVMSQPAGSLNSIMINNNGEVRKERANMLSQNLLVADVGFGTFDTYGLVNRKIEQQESINNLGMKRVLELAAEYIYKDKENSRDIRIPQMRQYLKQGYFTVLDIEHMRNKKVSLEPYVEKACNEIAEIACKKLYELSGYFSDYNILIVTGGTGAAWIQYFKDRFSEIETLDVIAGNEGCEDIPIHYANARGYYMTAYRSLNRTAKIKQEGGR